MTIIKSNLNDSLHDFYNVSIFWLDQTLQAISSQTIVIDSVLTAKMKTLCLCFKELSKKRLSVNLSLYKDFIFNSLAKFKVVFEFADASFTQKAMSSSVSLADLKLLKELYLTLIYIVCSGNVQINSEQIIAELVMLVMTKGQTYLSLFQKVEAKELKLQSEMKRVLKKMCIYATFDFSQIIAVSPLVFAYFFEQLLQYASTCFMYKWRTISVRKSTALLLYKILRCYFYYTKPGYLKEKKINEKAKTNDDLQKVCHDTYHAFFGNKNAIQNLMAFIVSELLAYTPIAMQKPVSHETLTNADTSDEESEQVETINVEAFIEDQEVGLDTIMSEMDCSRARIGSALFEQLLTRFPEYSLPLFYQSIEEVISGAMQVSDGIKDSILAQLTHLPKIYEFHNTANLNKIDVTKILSYLMQAGETQLVFKRRFLIVLKQWINQKEFGNRSELCSNLSLLLKTNDDIVQFEAMDCLAILIKSDYEGEIDYSKLIVDITPVFVNIISKFQSPGLVWKLGNYFCSVLEKVQYNLTQDTINALQNLNLQAIISRNASLMKPVFADVFRYFLAGLHHTNPTSILNLIMNYIDICFDTLEQEDNSSLLKFLGVFLRALENNSETSYYFQRVLARLLQNINVFTKCIEEDTTSNFLNIVEEFLLLGTPFDTFNLPTYLINLYQILSDETKGIPIETVFIIKSNLFSVFTTMILLSLETKTFTFENYKVF